MKVFARGSSSMVWSPWHDCPQLDSWRFAPLRDSLGGERLFALIHLLFTTRKTSLGASHPDFPRTASAQHTCTARNTLGMTRLRLRDLRYHAITTCVARYWLRMRLRRVVLQGHGSDAQGFLGFVPFSHSYYRRYVAACRVLQAMQKRCADL